MSIHIGAQAGQIAPTILLPGDPLRARHIAHTLLLTAQGKGGGYQIKDEAKLKAVASEYGIAVDGRSKEEIALDLAEQRTWLLDRDGNRMGGWPLAAADGFVCNGFRIIGQLQEGHPRMQATQGTGLDRPGNLGQGQGGIGLVLQPEATGAQVQEIGARFGHVR